MKRIVRNRADARLLPSRRDFALFRLVAWMRLSRAEPSRTSSMYFTDRHQTAVEMWTVGLWLLATTTLYVTDALSDRLHFAAALLTGFVTALLALQFTPVLSGLVVAPVWRSIVSRTTLPMRVNGFVVMFLFFASTGWAALRPSWVRYVAWWTITIAALNLIAAAVLYVFRDSIARLEASVVGGAASER